MKSAITKLVKESLETKVKVLALFLGLQLAAALAFSFGGSSLAPGAKPGPLLAIDMAQVDGLELAGPDGESLQLSKAQQGWQLPALDGFPADSQRVERMLERLQDLQSGLPVASSGEAQMRFKVADENFERKVQLKSGDKTVATLFLGSSPGMRRIHARLGNDEAIRVVEFAAHDVPVDSKSWQDKTVLQFAADEISGIAVAGLNFSRSNDGENAGEAADTSKQSVWQVSGLNDGEALNEQAVKKLADLIADLRFDEVLGRESKADYGLEEPALELSITRTDGASLQYLLGKSPDTSQYTLKVSNRPEYFRLPAFRADPLIDASKRRALITPTDSDESDGDRKEELSSTFTS